MTKQPNDSIIPFLKQLSSLCGSKKRTLTLFLLTMLVCSSATAAERNHRHDVLRVPTKASSAKKRHHPLLVERQSSDTAPTAPSPTIEPLQRSEPQLPSKVSVDTSKNEAKADAGHSTTDAAAAKSALRELINREAELRRAASADSTPAKTIPTATPPTPTPSPTPSVEQPTTPTMKTPEVPSTTPPSGSSWSTTTTANNSTGYIINFPNVNIIEYIKFISKISNTNFIFNEEDLQFKVTIVSEEPTSVDNVMAALLQVLRVNGLSLVEQGNNVLIYRGADLSKIATVVTDESNANANSTSPLMTRLFKLHNISPVIVESLIKPMLSNQALIESSVFTNHLIVTDIRTNIDKISLLLESLDGPNSPYEISRYEVKNVFINSLVSLAHKILQPIQGANALVLVPQPVTNTVFIISTPYLIQQTLDLFNTLDLGVPLKGGAVSGESTAGRPYITNPQMPGKQNLEGTRMVMYKLQYHRGQEIQQALEAIAASLAAGFPQASLLKSPLSPNLPTGPYGYIQSEQKTISGYSDQESGVPNSTKQSAVNAPNPSALATEYQIPPVQSPQSTDQQSQPTTGPLAQQSSADLDLVRTISTVQWIQSSNTLVFTGDQASTEKLKTLIQELDFPLKQVFIECLVLETTIAHSLSFGVNTGGLINYQGIGANPSGLAGGVTNQGDPPPLTSALLNPAIIPTAVTLPLGVTTATAPGPIAAGFGVGAIGRMVFANGKVFATLGGLISALQEDTSTQILLNPNILTQDNYEASIFVGTNIPYQTQSVVSQASTTVINFEYLNVGTLLKITPLIANDELVTLTVRQEISAVAPTAGTGSSLTPATTTSTTISRVNVPNDHFLVLSGQIQDQHSEFRAAIPCLGGLPVIGALFGQNAPSDNINNLIIFLRPHILTTAEDADAITQSQRANYEERSDTDFLKNDWDILRQLLNINKRPPEPYESTVPPPPPPPPPPPVEAPTSP
jgi:type III secretion protein C